MKSGQLFFIAIISLLMSACGTEEIKPEKVLEDFILDINKMHPVNTHITPTSGKSEGAYLKSRIFAEKLLTNTIQCDVTETEAKCSCETNSGKKRNFVLLKSENNWKVDLNAPEIILENFHLLYNNGLFKEALEFATTREKENTLTLVDLSATDEKKVFNDVKILPFEIKCKTFKKKMECSCVNEESKSVYLLFKSSKEWKVEFKMQEDLMVNDSIIDYNNPEDFNLNQHDLDSLTDFSRKMLDSMLSL